MAAEYLDNLRKGGCFVKTDRPLPIGRDCQIELRAPGLEPPLVLDGVVTWSSADLPVLGPGQAPGMGIEYQMDERQYRDVQQRLQALMA
jgi:Tfp pilus assembly protein PilZ